MSEEKIIYRRNRLIEMAKVEAKPYTPFYYILEENINDINYLLYENKQLKEDKKKAIEYIKNEISLIDKDLIECELTYAEKQNFEIARNKYVSVLEILGDKENE